MLLLWLLSLKLRDVSIIDTFWGPGFALLAWTYLLSSPATGPRGWLLAILVTIWGLRLGLHIGLRGRGQGEDYRYAAMRTRRGQSFWWLSLFQVFGLQAAIMLGISAPLLEGSKSLGELGWLDLLGVGIFLLGLGFEAVGDLQLRRFKGDPSNRGQTLKSGLWRYTRHPNYFGDALLWWGLFVLGGLATGAYWTIYAPLAMSLLLMRVSGVPLLEARLRSTRPDFSEYARRTNAFFPWIPKRLSPEMKSS